VSENKRMFAVGEDALDEDATWHEGATPEAAAEDWQRAHGRWSTTEAHVEEIEPVDVAEAFAEWLGEYELERFDEYDDEYYRDWDEPIIDLCKSVDPTGKIGESWRRHIAQAVRGFKAEHPEFVADVRRKVRGGFSGTVVLKSERPEAVTPGQIEQ
jgi:hypothetical protein